MSKAEKFIIEHTRNCSNTTRGYRTKGAFFPSYCIPWLTPDQAKEAVEIARSEIYEWLLNHNDYITANGNITHFDMEKCVNDLKQAMKDET